MAQIIPDDNGIGSALGSGLGAGLGTALQSLAQVKLQNLLQSQQVPGFVNAATKAGYPPEIANLLAQLSPQERTAFFQRVNPGDFSAPQGGQPNLSNSLQQLSPQPPLEQSPEVTPKKPSSFAEIFARPSPHEQEENKRAAWKQHGKFISGLTKQDTAKVQEDSILKRIINIREGGKARSALLTNVMRDIGIDYQALKNGETLELEKLGKFFLRGGPAMFGGKVSNFEAQNLLSQVPNELQTDEGAIRLANQMLTLNKSVHEENKLMNKIIEENGGVPPLDLELKLAKRMEPINEKLAEEFIQGRTSYTTKKEGDIGSRADKLPQASAANKGWEYEDEDTGNIYVSDGSKWSKKGK